MHNRNAAHGSRTAGSGGWGSGPVHSVSSDRMSVTLNYTLLAPNYPPIGATLIGLSGPGVGATHLITTYSNDTSGRSVLGLASPIGDIESLKTEGQHAAADLSLT